MLLSRPQTPPPSAESADEMKVDVLLPPPPSPLFLVCAARLGWLSSPHRQPHRLPPSRTIGKKTQGACLSAKFIPKVKMSLSILNEIELDVFCRGSLGRPRDCWISHSHGFRIIAVTTFITKKKKKKLGYHCVELHSASLHTSSGCNMRHSEKAE